MAITGNSIFHFTREISSLEAILSERFRPSYSLEQLDSQDDTVRVASPMVSFCDLPLLEVSSHILKYGAYGLGLKKDWAEQHKLCPVQYISNGSDYQKSFFSVLKAHLRKAMDENDEKKDDAMLKIPKTNGGFIDLLRYMKPYQGPLKLKWTEYENYRFYDEREWRFVPSIGSGAQPIASQKQYEADRASLEDGLEGIRLEFLPDDINFIILKDNEEIPKFLSYIRGIEKFSAEEKDILGTKILTCESLFDGIDASWREKLNESRRLSVSERPNTPV